MGYNPQLSQKHQPKNNKNRNKWPRFWDLPIEEALQSLRARSYRKSQAMVNCRWPEGPKGWLSWAMKWWMSTDFVKVGGLVEW